MDNTLLLTRFAYLPTGTYGELLLPNGISFYTVERPWLNNSPNVSCIPEGHYDLLKRLSPTVKRTTRSEYIKGWEVTSVPGRTFIMVHPGNWPHDVQGCIALGLEFKVAPNQGSHYGVMKSRQAFREFMEVSKKHREWRLDITVKQGVLK